VTHYVSAFTTAAVFQPGTTTETVIRSTRWPVSSRISIGPPGAKTSSTSSRSRPALSPLGIHASCKSCLVRSRCLRKETKRWRRRYAVIPPPSTLLTVTNVGPSPTGSNPRGPNRSDCRGNHRDSPRGNHHRGSHRRESRRGLPHSPLPWTGSLSVPSSVPPWPLAPQRWRAQQRLQLKPV